MGNYSLVIVESASKSKTIQKYLNDNQNGDTYKVVASLGHIVDLPGKELGIDVENWKLKYETLPNKFKVIKQLKDLAEHAKEVYLASDPDREGEAIAWHLKNTLKLSRPKRILFHEITKKAIQEAITHPTQIDMDLVYSQESRRALDRLVGFKLSPLLWTRFTSPGLSAGRVQSVALKNIVERYLAYEKHEIKKYWNVEGYYNVHGKNLETDLVTIQDKKKKEYEELESGVKILNFIKQKKIDWSYNIEFKKSIRNPAPPYTTSALQQEVYETFGIPAKDTMKHAQALYEMGAITYMRTDSVQLSKDAKQMIKDYVINTFSIDEFQERNYKSKVANAQEAHECIRPTNLQFDTSELNPSQKKIYNIIWRKAVASQMVAAEYCDVLVHITSKDDFMKQLEFFGKISYVEKLGYLKVWNPKQKEEHKEIAEWKKNIKISPEKFIAKAHVTKPDGLYNEPALIKWMEKEGIGRPSTYAATVDKLIQKGYIVKGPNPLKTETVTHAILDNHKIEKEEEVISIGGKEKDRFIPNAIGINIIEYLNSIFPKLMDYHFTAHMEEQLDEISRKELQKEKLLESFYKEIVPILKEAEKERKEYLKTRPKKEKKELAPGKDNILKEFPNEDTQLIKTRYGPALFNTTTKTFISVAPFLQWKKKEIDDLTNKDVKFLKSLPIALTEEIQIQYGRYGLYLKNKDKNYRIPKELWESIYDKTYSDKELLKLMSA
jgi:DNA topoisomerase I